MIFFEGKEYDLTMGKYSTELFTAENLENLERQKFVLLTFTLYYSS